MGLTAGRLHVRAEDGSGVESVVRALAGGPDALGLARGPVGPSSGLILYRAPGSSWVSVADVPADRYLLEPGVARRIAAAVGGSAVVTEVWDSDASAVKLIVDGRADRPIRFPVPENEVAERFAPWSELLGPDVTPADLVAATTGRRTLAEDHLVELLTLLGIDAVAATGPIEEAAGGDRRLLEAWTQQHSMPAQQRRRQGPPDIEKSLERVRELVTGQELPITHSFAIMNLGGHADGLRVTVAGSALEHGHIELDVVTVVRDEGSRQVVAPFVGGTALLDISVPAGGWDRRAGKTHALWLQLRGRGRSAGAATLDLEVSTLAPEISTAEAPVAVDVLPVDELPRGISTAWAGAVRAKDLITPAHLVGCFVLDPERVTGEQLLTTIERFLQVPGLLEPETAISVLSLDRTRGLGVKKVRAKDLGVAKRWLHLADLLDELPDLHIAAGSRVETVTRRSSGNRRPRGSVIDEPVVMTLSAKIDGAPADVVDAAEVELLNRGDELLDAGVLIQGFCDRWTAGGIFAVNAYWLTTDWNAGNVAGPWLDSLPWARRYLCAVAATVWLGPDFADAVGSASLDGLLTAIGSGAGAGWRIDAPTGAGRRRVEDAMPSVVPGLATIDPAFHISD